MAPDTAEPETTEMPSRRLPRPGDDTTPETGPDRGECECGDWRDQHVLGRGPCRVCGDSTAPYDECDRYREAFVFPGWWTTTPDSATGPIHAQETLR